MYDLHTHSTFSDGILRPEELVSRAKTHGVTTLALTDHDTLQGIGVAQQAAHHEGIDLIPGIEFSCLWNGVGIHILGLNVDVNNLALIEGVAQQEQRRIVRAQTIADRLAKAGVSGALEGAREYAGEGAIGRPHFAKYLVASGVVSNMNQAFKQYLGAGKVGDVKQLWPDINTAVNWIINAGGVAVVAHPNKYKLTRTKLRRLLSEFIEAGGQAIEVISGKQTPNVTRDMAALADQLGLYASGGSDFHMPDQPWQELGCVQFLPKNCRPVWQLWDKESSL